MRIMIKRNKLEESWIRSFKMVIKKNKQKMKKFIGHFKNMEKIRLAFIHNG